MAGHQHPIQRHNPAENHTRTSQIGGRQLSILESHPFPQKTPEKEIVSIVDIFYALVQYRNPGSCTLSQSFVRFNAMNRVAKERERRVRRRGTFYFLFTHS